MPFKDRWRKQTLEGTRGTWSYPTVHARTIGFRGYRRLTPEDGASTLEESEPFEPK
jgi:hypothetical protein